MEFAGTLPAFAERGGLPRAPSWSPVLRAGLVFRLKRLWVPDSDAREGEGNLRGRVAFLELPLGLLGFLGAGARALGGRGPAMSVSSTHVHQWFILRDKFKININIPEIHSGEACDILVKS